eukprot:m.183388 g.183388  ORF g.183388 m.183388 type:complete len:184 (+) comp24654_c0_seq2:3157-3708(+)
MDPSCCTRLSTTRLTRLQKAERCCMNGSIRPISTCASPSAETASSEPSPYSSSGANSSFSACSADNAAIRSIPAAEAAQKKKEEKRTEKKEGTTDHQCRKNNSIHMGKRRRAARSSREGSIESLHRKGTVDGTRTGLGFEFADLIAERDKDDDGLVEHLVLRPDQVERVGLLTGCQINLDRVA